MKNRQPSLKVRTNPEFEKFEFDSRLRIDQHLGSHKHVINTIMGFRDMGCYSTTCQFLVPAAYVIRYHK
jgi:hypothetical protein